MTNYFLEYKRRFRIPSAYFRKIVFFSILLLLIGCNEPSDDTPQDIIFTDQAYRELLQGNYPKAEAYLEVALSINPENPYALLNLGVVYQDTGRVEKARQLYKRIIEMNPDDIAANSNNAAFHGKKLVDIAKENLRALNGY